MGWVKFVEDKLKRDNKIDHQSLLWELGSEVVEHAQVCMHVCKYVCSVNLDVSRCIAIFLRHCICTAPDTWQELAGGMNVSLETELMHNLTTWFEAGGGKLRYVEPTISKDNGIKLTVREGLSIHTACA